MEAEDPQPEIGVSHLFCDDDADVVFVSSDDLRLKIHSEHLTTTSSLILARSPHDTLDSRSEPIPLQESGDVLELLFQFIEPPPKSRNYKHPSMDDVESALFFRVAEAAEKYVVYGLMSLCFSQMRQIVSNYPFEVLNHCCLHDYTDLANKAAILSISHSLSDIDKKFTAPGLYSHYSIYYSKWRDAVKEASEILFPPDHTYTCHRLLHMFASYRIQTDKDPSIFDKLPTPPRNNIKCTSEDGYDLCTCRLFEGNGCPKVVKLLKIKIPKFSMIRI